jgi:toxin CptA
MHAAPSVTYPVGRSPFAAWLYALAGLAGLGVAVAWSVQSATFGWRQGLALGAVFACGSLALASWRRSPTGVLRWDGVGWTWEEGPVVGGGRPEIALDLQNRMLLAWQPESGRVRWLWLERARDPAHWEALRRAVYSRASTPVPNFSEREKGTPPAGDPPTASQ